MDNVSINRTKVGPRCASLAAVGSTEAAMTTSWTEYSNRLASSSSASGAAAAKSGAPASARFLFSASAARSASSFFSVRPARLSRFPADGMSSPLRADPSLPAAPADPSTDPAGPAPPGPMDVPVRVPAASEAPVSFMVGSEERSATATLTTLSLGGSKATTASPPASRSAAAVPFVAVTKVGVAVVAPPPTRPRARGPARPPPPAPPPAAPSAPLSPRWVVGPMGPWRISSNLGREDSSGASSHRKSCPTVVATASGGGTVARGVRPSAAVAVVCILTRAP